MSTRGGVEDEVPAPAPPSEGDQDFDPGWLGTVLRWPVRIVAVAVMLPVQVGWESLKAAARFTQRKTRWAAPVVMVPLRFTGRSAKSLARGVRKALRPVGRGAGVLLRGLRDVQVVVTRRVTRTVWAVLVGGGRLTVRAVKWTYRMTVLADQGIRFLRKTLADSSRAMWAAGGPTLMRLLRILHQGVIFALALCLVPPLFVLRICWRLYRRIRPRVRMCARWVFAALAKGFALLGRAIWWALRLLGRGLVSLGYALVEGFRFGFRLGRRAGRGVVWLWTILVWRPIGQIWRIWRRATKPAWRFAARIGRVMGEALLVAGRNIRAVTGQARGWYRREMAAPIGAVLRSARQDVRRALTGRKSAERQSRPTRPYEQANVKLRDDRMPDRDSLD